MLLVSWYAHVLALRRSSKVRIVLSFCSSIWRWNAMLNFNFVSMALWFSHKKNCGKIWIIVKHVHIWNSMQSNDLIEMYCWAKSLVISMVLIRMNFDKLIRQLFITHIELYQIAILSNLVTKSIIIFPTSM